VIDIPAFTAAKLVLDLATPERRKAELTKLGWLHTEMVYPREDGHPSQYWPGSTWNNFVDIPAAAASCQRSRGHRIAAFRRVTDRW